ncbi:SMI1/KNR4 family protein [Tenacibaculum tangerinum]|uniref:SMI1/KNR4 family protein n=1 Tax=Tenacibaculum tangerinum TaxID=3038772 RepID=A0ABY8L2Q6_9FLAO|nr:SMI1/KNR4 family protein [Tenacibaculum tangerinum]WGH74643.1 SMI1/KNR4 family protein [Tenacibaculum tangerinum]
MKDIKITESAKPVSLDEFNSFINKYNLKLPETYKSFILKYNGGYPKLSAYGNPYEDGSEIDSFYSVTLKDNNEIDDLIISSRDVIKSHQIMEDNIPSHFYPFADDSGGAKFCLSMRQEDFGKIYLVFLDGTSNEPTLICDSFEEFINGLEDIEKYEED